MCRSFFFWIFLSSIAFVGAVFMLPRETYAHRGNTFTIEMRGKSFSPAKLEIQEGDTVVFKNADALARWPASNIHPSHLIFPEFDPKREILPGESWKFTFRKKGEWKFHDHVYTSAGGTIVVRDDPDYPPAVMINSSPPEKKEKVNAARALYEKIYNSLVALAKVHFATFPGERNKFLASLNMLKIAKDEHSGELRFWLEVFGVEPVVKDLLADSGGGSVVDCHQEIHRVGRIAYEIYGPVVFAKGDAACHSGFYHGAIETLLAQKGTEHLAEEISAICTSFPTSFGNFECLHGSGHGVLAYTNYDLPEALTTCDKLGTDYSAQSCYGGIFMENVVTAQGLGATKAHTTTWVNNDPQFPCSGISKTHAVQYQCYQMQTSRMLMLTGYNFEKVIPMCLNAPEAYRAVCFKSFGRDAAGHTLRSVPKIVETCGKAPAGNYREECIIGAVNVIVDFWGGGLRGQATELCSALGEASTREACFRTLGGRLADIFGKDMATKQQVCATFPADRRHLCEN